MTQFMKVKAQEIRMTNKHLHILSGCIYYIISYVSKILINKVIKNRILDTDIHNFGLEYTLQGWAGYPVLPDIRPDTGYLNYPAGYPVI